MTPDSALNERTIEIAAAGGHYSIYKYLISENCPVYMDSILYRAAEAGQQNFLKRLWNAGEQLDWVSCAGAARGGHLELLKWLRKTGCEWDEETTEQAAEKGHLEVLRWAVENGCPFSDHTFYFAAYDSSLEAAKYLLEQGCPWDEGFFIYAAQLGYTHTMDWAIENGCPIDWVSLKNIKFLCSSNLNTLEWFAKKFELDYVAIAEYAIQHCRLDTLKWAVESAGWHIVSKKMARRAFDQRFAPEVSYHMD